jgi:dUTP pyrophosphatase
MIPLSIEAVVADPKYLPTRARPGDAGLDLKAHLPTVGFIDIPSGQQVLISTGLQIAIPFGWVGFVTPRSGMALKQRVRIGNAPGTIDAAYRDTVGVIFLNAGSEPVTVKDGDRIAQLVILPCFLGDLEVVDALDSTERGTGGFGSTGA